MSKRSPYDLNKLLCTEKVTRYIISDQVVKTESTLSLSCMQDIYGRHRGFI